MKLSLRSLPALVVAALLALPGVGSEGGEGAGGTGVWILPGPKFVGTAPLTAPVTAAAPTSQWVGDIKLAAAPGMDGVTAMLIDEVSGESMALPVCGREVVLDRSVLAGLIAAGVNTAHIVIVDANQLGYVFKVAVDAANASATLQLR